MPLLFVEAVHPSPPILDISRNVRVESKDYKMFLYLHYVTVTFKGIV